MHPSHGGGFLARRILSPCSARTKRAGLRAPCYRAAGEARAPTIIGLGLDLIELDRVARALERWGERLVAKLMDPPEAAGLPPSGPERSRALALAIAAKEAASKALGTGWTRGVRWRDVVLEPGPPPRVRLEGGAARRARALGSRGRCDTALEIRDGMALGEVRLRA
ncbi:MAG TPA: 4'-phosphopantetheinyl transferase superfamily protein [Vicinamibacteria bacterium]